ncbi:cytochrome P450 protein [Rutstroemia sp. NJR-2017a BBW]|nr:cytochrome P450 protein [Rutstroemia sp. NJR-2017a BBW]
MAYTSLLILGSLVVLLCYVTFERLFKSKKQLPPGAKPLPGPKGWPIVGSVPDLAPKNPWLKIHDWAQEYGPIVQVNLNGENTIWITSNKICEDLFVKRGAIYSHRPWLPAIGDDCRFSNRYIPLVTYTDDMKRIKAWMKNTMFNMPADRLKDLSQKGAATFVTRLIAEPHLFKQFCEECTAGISSQMAWGDARLSTAKETVMRANTLLRRISGDGDIQNKIPLLRSIPSWVPHFLQPWHAAELARFKRERNFWFGQKEAVRREVTSGEKTPEPSWMSRYLMSKTPASPEIDEDNTYSIGMLALIGGVLTSSPIQSFFSAMLFAPEWQKKAQEEVDRVCGERQPHMDDIQNLPIVRAIIREIFRWRSPAPAGVPHVVLQDDIYEGYHIPAGSTCLAFEWTLQRDPTLYPDPENFHPERWLDPSWPSFREPLTHYPSIKSHSGFGWGRRACIGQDHTETVLITVIATILWSVDVRRKIDPNTGKEMQIRWFDYTAYVIVRPEWFPFDVVGRGEGRVGELKGKADWEVVEGREGGRLREQGLEGDRGYAGEKIWVE